CSAGDSSLSTFF
nr:immunoglobulin light chain junction region [Macaca mulatta]MPN68982.1 immunoglobulin light chain junction region [Macaca mulatta]